MDDRILNLFLCVVSVLDIELTHQYDGKVFEVGQAGGEEGPGGGLLGLCPPGAHQVEGEAGCGVEPGGVAGPQRGGRARVHQAQLPHLTGPQLGCVRLAEQWECILSQPYL